MKINTMESLLKESLSSFYRKYPMTGKEKEKVDKIQKERTAIQKKADDVYERFKKGEKLSTEDFMLLQKAGLI